MITRPQYVFSISTPLQYINAIELIHSQKLTFQECILILLSPFERTQGQIRGIGHLEKWHTVFYPFYKKKNEFLLQVKLFFLLRRFRKLIAVIGNLNDFRNIYLIKHSIQYSHQPIVLDDGSSTIIFWNKRIANEFRISIKGIRNKLLNQLYHIDKNVQIDNLDFFSCIKHLPYNTKDNLLLNKYSFFKSNSDLSNSVDDSLEFWFAGAPFVRFNIIEKDIYMKCLLQLKFIAEDMGLKFKYFAHRTELEFDSKNLSEFDVVVNEDPFEIYYYKTKYKPQVVASFYSACLFTLSAMDAPSQLMAFDVAEGDVFVKSIDKAEKDEIIQIYNHIGKYSNIQKLKFIL